VGPRGNSGIKYFVVEQRGRPIAHEYQMLDDAGYEVCFRNVKILAPRRR
jgi:hypothetical protein